MPTELDLREAFAELERRADDVGLPDLLPRAAAAGRRRRTVHRVAALGTAAAVVAGGLAVALAVVPGDDDAAPAAPGPPVSRSVTTPTTPTTPIPPTALAFDPDEYSFTVGPVPGFTVVGGDTFDTYQVREIDGPGNAHYDLTLNAPGNWSGARPKGAKTVTLAGHQGWYGHLRDLPSGVASGSPVGLAWEYSPGAWATVAPWDGDSVPLDQALQIANAVLPGRTQPVRGPLQVPAKAFGLELSSTVGIAGTTRESQHGPIGFNMLLNYDLTGPSGGAVSIELTPPGTDIDHGGPYETINGQHAYVRPDGVYVFGADYLLMVTPDDNGDGTFSLSRTQLRKLAEQITVVSDPADPSSWSPLRR